MSARLVKTANIVFLLLGVGLLVGLLVRMDLNEVVGHLVRVGWYFPLAFLAYTLSNMTTTLAWKQIINPAESSARYRDLLAAFWAGHAMNAVTPGASLGEVIKGSIMTGRVEGEEIVASLVTLNFLNALTVQLFTLVGPLACLLLTDFPTRVVLILFGTAGLFFIPVALFYALLRIGAAHKIVWLLTRLPVLHPKNPDALMERANSVDRRIRAFKERRPAAFYKALFYLFVVRLFQVAELWVILLVLVPDQGAPSVLLLAVLTQTATQLLAWAMTFVPGQVGVAEGGAALFYRFLGMDPLIGLAMELVRRIRKVLGIAIGLAIGLWASAKRK